MGPATGNESRAGRQSPQGWATGRSVPAGSAADLCLLLTVEEAARRLGIGRTTAFALVQAGHLRSVRIGRLRRVPVDAMEEYVRGLGQS